LPADQIGHNILHVGAALIGPVLPPEMIWRNMFEHLQPGLMSKSVPLSIRTPAFLMAKRSWHIAFDVPNHLELGKDLHCQSVDRVPIIIKRRPVARALVFEPLDNVEDSGGPAITFSASPVTVKKKRGHKQKPLVVQPEERRFTRSSLKLNGFRPTPVMAATPRQ
jgi:hypothetical protein